MDHLAEEFIAARRSMVVGRGRRYPARLRRLAVEFAIEASQAGWRVGRIARHLGIRRSTLERWCAEPEAEGAVEMREVVVSEEAGFELATGAVLVTPEGYRVEGLSGEALVELLRALRR